MRRRFAGALVALVSVMAAALLVTGAGASADSTTQLTVAVWSNWNFVQRAADAYTKSHPNVKIKISAIPGEQYFSSLPRTLGTSGGADITALEVTGTGSYRALVQQHALADLSGVWSKLGLAKVTPAAVTKSYTEKSGARYAVNIDETILPVVYYNEDLFAKLHLEVGANHRVTWGQFNQYVSALKGQSDIPMTYAWSTDAHHLFQQYLLSSCGKQTYYALAASWQPGAKASWKQPCVVRAIQGEKTLADNGTFGSNPIISYDVASADFVAQKAGMLLTGMWAISSLEQQAKFKWGWFLMPPPPGGAPTKWLLYSADGLGVNAHSKNKAVAEDFLASMMTRSFQGSLYTDGRPPSRTDAGVPKGAAQPLVQMVKSTKTLGSETHFMGILAPADFQDVVVTGSQNVLLGKQTPAGLAGQLQQLAVKLRKK